ncbi:MAG: twin-arginine translocase subunit TatC [Planctomycetes bacterium]|nr:twin-arginine translocase subunit TatC [Planctomycetota bacterium]
MFSDDIDIVDAPQSWHGDEEGYPGFTMPEPLPDRLPETDAMQEDSEPDPPDNSPRLPSFGGIGSHLEELRKRLIISISVFIPSFAIGLWFYQSLWNAIILPLDRAAPHLQRFQALSPSDGLIMAMRIAFAFSLVLSLPVWMSQVWHFVVPGLTAAERRWLNLALGTGSVLFGIGVATAYFVGIPLALEYLLPFNQSMTGWENSFTGPGYVDFVITCCIGFGLAFELPLIMFVLGWSGLLTPGILAEWWRVVVLVIFILAAVLTPPDPFTQLLLALSLLVLFLFGWRLVKWTAGRKG